MRCGMLGLSQSTESIDNIKLNRDARTGRHESTTIQARASFEVRAHDGCNDNSSAERFQHNRRLKRYNKSGTRGPAVQPRVRLSARAILG